jgi:hypothetical protein
MAQTPPPDAPPAAPLSKAWIWLRANGLNVGVEVLINILLPLAIYDYFRASLGDVHALMASSAPPIVWSLIIFARKRTLDAVSILVLAGIALSLLAFLGGGSVRFLQLREKMITGLIGLLFLGSAAIGKPLIYQLARGSIARGNPSQLQNFEALQANAQFRQSMTVMTLVWGFGLLAECAMACALVLTLPVATYLVVGPIMGYSVVGLLALWSLWYRARRQRIGAARRAAEEAAKAEPVAK